MKSKSLVMIDLPFSSSKNLLFYFAFGTGSGKIVTSAWVVHNQSFDNNAIMTKSIENFKTMEVWKSEDFIVLSPFKEQEKINNFGRESFKSDDKTKIMEFFLFVLVFGRKMTE